MDEFKLDLGLFHNCSVSTYDEGENIPSFCDMMIYKT